MDMAFSAQFEQFFEKIIDVLEIPKGSESELKNSMLTAWSAIDWPKLATKKITGYRLFVKETSPTITDLVGKMRLVEVNRRWASYNKEEKKLWSDRAAAFTPEEIELLSNTTKKPHKSSSASHKSGEGEKKKRQPTGYNLFMKNKSVLIKSKFSTQRERMSAMGKMWKELDEDTKKLWNESAKNGTEPPSDDTPIDI